ncbi:M50 family metallopeptidase [Cryptosporangium sp. NPDC051539]|uniref:M50 family metallopeptidase n=1 Tax=Cryptosporangium sp. NPDC051539 TaxID=3363962 RepID=UPI0037AE7D1D
MTHIAQPQPAAPLWLIVCTALVAVGLVGTSVLLRWLMLAGHEGAHAMMGDWTGTVVSVTINSRSGETLVKADWFGSLLTGFVGYVGPSSFGLLGAAFLDHDHPVAALWLTIVLLGALLWKTVNPYGLFAMATLAGLLLIVAWSASVWIQTAVAYLLVWSLLVVGFEDVRTLSVRSDHTILRKITWVPATIWAFLHLVLAAIALLVGGRMLLTD